ncbi:MAG: VOC family protein [Gemmatimonadota bacterium]|nr:VOC family protein [Gemmatimonadota bacterium]
MPLPLRRRPTAPVQLLLLLALLAGTAPAAHLRAQVATVRSVDAVGFTVSDMDRSVAFFTHVLTFAKVSDVEVTGDTFDRLVGVFGTRARIVRLRLGDETVELTQFLAPGGRPIPMDARSNDRTFQHIAIVVRNIDSAYAHLRQHRVTHVSSGPQRLPDWNPNAGGISAFYFKDPDGHALEIIHFPAGKGDPRWQAPTARLFLGIDHTAIVVGETDASLAFYRDVLGMRVAGESENYGPEQERLNAVFGARLRITALRAPVGPGIEFLEYLTPRDGRPAPADARATDLAHWQTTLTTADVAAVRGRLRAAGYQLVSPIVVADLDPALGVARGTQVRDPDGHVLQLVEPAGGEAPPAKPRAR